MQQYNLQPVHCVLQNHHSAQTVQDGMKAASLTQCAQHVNVPNGFSDINKK